MTSRALLASAILGLVLAAPGSAWAQTVRLLGDFNDWSSYATSEGAGAVCFALTQPSEVEPEPEGYTQGYLYVTHRPGEGVRNEINLVAGFDFAADSMATISVGSQSFSLFTQGDAAWLDDPAQSESLAAAIRAGSTLRVEATTAAGIRVTQTFSLSGATAASQAIGAECAD